MQWTFTGEIERFDGRGSWHHVDVPADIGDEFEHDGFVPVIAEVGASWWETSVMPRGDGTRFVAIKAAVRRANDLDEGDPITVTIRRR